MSHVLLIIPTQTYRASDFLAAAAELGVELSVASEEELPLIAPDRRVWIDCSRPEWSAQILADHASRHPIDAIVPLDDQGVVVAARAAELMGLAHTRPRARPPPATRPCCVGAWPRTRSPSPGSG